MRNFTGFDTLPLVEFVPRAEIPAKKVMEFLKMDPPEEGSGFLPQKGKKPAKGGYDGWQQENRDEQTMQFGQNDDLENDLFTNRMLEWLESQVNPDQYKPVEVDERILKSMRFEEIFIVDYSQLCPQWPKKYYKNMVPDVAITNCDKCCKFFLQDEYEFAYMEKGCCPFCKHVEKDKGVKNVYGSLADMNHR